MSPRLYFIFPLPLNDHRHLFTVYIQEGMGNPWEFKA
jgi:hypothetical protein